MTVRQEAFEQPRRETWARFEALLDALEARRPRDVADFPSLYRAICQDLALARERGFSASLIERLHRMALRGHEQLYAARAHGLGAGARELLQGFPRALREQRRTLLFVSAIFLAIGASVGGLAFRELDFLHGLLDPEQIEAFETMYGPAAQAREGAAEDRALMFGLYVWNNVSILFRAFASGLVLGIGSLFFVAYNGAYIGALAGHLTRLGHIDALARFVVAHGAFEIPSLLIAAAAGTALGRSWLEPGACTRLRAVRERARSVLPLVCGAAVMGVIAAGIEAFWSALPYPAAVEYGVGGALWLLVLGTLAFLGSHRAA
jgi:uncharacterized membrane protein SpoIIM required for sporulation